MRAARIQGNQGSSLPFSLSPSHLLAFPQLKNPLNAFSPLLSEPRPGRPRPSFPPSLLFPSSAQALPASLPASSPERGVKVFHKLDTTFKVPKVQFFAHLLSRQVGRDGRRGDRCDGEIEGE